MHNCDKCGTETMSMSTVQVTYPSKYNYKLSKRVIASKHFQVTSQNHEMTSYICPACGHFEDSIYWKERREKRKTK